MDIKLKDASIYLRNQLKANYVTLPQVSPRIPIKRYFELAERLYKQAYQYYLKKETQYINAYIDYQKFLLLTLDRIPKHPQYNLINTSAKSNPNLKNEDKKLIESKIWLEGIRGTAFKTLEEVVRLMDKIEYDRHQALAIDTLEAEFDDVDINSAGVAPPSSSALSPTVSDSGDVKDDSRPVSTKDIPNLIARLSFSSLPSSEGLLSPTAPVMEDVNSAMTTVESTISADAPLPLPLPLPNTTHSIETTPIIESSQLPLQPPLHISVDQPIIPESLASESRSTTIQISEHDFDLLNYGKLPEPAAPVAPSAPLPFPEPSLLPAVPAPADLPLSTTLTQGALIEQQQPAANTSKWDILKNPYDLSPKGETAKSLPLPQPVDFKSQVSLPLPPVNPLASITSPAVVPPVTANIIPATPLLPLEDLIIAKHLLTRATSSFAVPPPVTTVLNIPINQYQALSFFRDDFHVSFTGFLSNIPIELQMSRAALEGNRCFFIHVGIGVGIHPFLLQSFFRFSSHNILQKNKGQWYEDLLTSVINYCDLVDANALSILWPKEFDNYYFCFISGNLQHPVITTFKKNNKVPVEQLQEVIIHCDGSHFTLLRPRMSPQTNTPVRVKMISQIVDFGKMTQCTVQENVSMELEGVTEEERSIEGIVRRLLSSS